MAHYAKVLDDEVVQVIIAEEDFMNNFVDTTPGTWIETFQDGSKRKRFAGIGMKYDSVKDIFIFPQPYPSWVLDEDTCEWKSPIAHPSDAEYSLDGKNPNNYNWNETDKSWDAVE